MVKPRIAWIDVAKGILIILVVVGHSHFNPTVDYIINSFHMAAFFALSGVTYKHGNSFKNFILKKVKSILIPYLFFSLVLLLYYFAKSFFLHQGNFDFFSGITSIVVPVSGITTTSVYGLWFLPCLFLSEVVFYMLVSLFKRKVWLSFSAYAFATALVVTITVISDKISVLTIVPLSVLYLVCGYVLHKVSENFNKYRYAILPISAALMLAFSFLNKFYFTSTLDLSSLTCGCILLYFIGNLFGTVMVVTLSMLLQNVKLLSFIGKDSLSYYGLHYEVLGVCQRISGLQYIWPILVFAFLVLPITLYKNFMRRLKGKRDGKHNRSRI